MVVIGVAKGTNRGKKSTKHARKFWFLYEIDSEYRIRKSKIQHGRFYTIKSSVRKKLAKFVHIVKKVTPF